MQKQAKEAALKEQEDKPKANLEALKEQVGQWGWPRARVESRGLGLGCSYLTLMGRRQILPYLVNFVQN
jgi:hypothetical protein